jgi:hypothetical protein
MKRTIRWMVAALFVLAALPAFPQQSRNALYFELGGNAVVPSINYERRVNESWYGRAGLSVVQSESGGLKATTYIIPVTASWVSHRDSNHHLEVGGGVTLAAGDRQDLYGDVGSDSKFSTLLATGIVGYRYQKPRGGFQFRAAFTPVAGSGFAAPWLGVSFGYAW